MTTNDSTGHPANTTRQLRREAITAITDRGRLAENAFQAVVDAVNDGWLLHDAGAGAACGSGSGKASLACVAGGGFCCGSAAFALVANRQESGDPSVQQYPPLKERGGEFFVRASARVMDEAGLDRLEQSLRAPGLLVDRPDHRRGLLEVGRQREADPDR